MLFKLQYVYTNEYVYNGRSTIPPLWDSFQQIFQAHAYTFTRREKQQQHQPKKLNGCNFNLLFVQKYARKNVHTDHEGRNIKNEKAQITKVTK